MVSSEWIAAMKPCIAMREVAEAVTLCSFTPVWYRSYAIRLINRPIQKIKKVDRTGEAFHYDCWHNNVDNKDPEFTRATGTTIFSGEGWLSEG